MVKQKLILKNTFFSWPLLFSMITFSIKEAEELETNHMRPLTSMFKSRKTFFRSALRIKFPPLWREDISFLFLAH